MKMRYKVFLYIVFYLSIYLPKVLKKLRLFKSIKGVYLMKKCYKKIIKIGYDRINKGEILKK